MFELKKNKCIDNPCQKCQVSFMCPRHDQHINEFLKHHPEILEMLSICHQNYPRYYMAIKEPRSQYVVTSRGGSELFRTDSFLGLVITMILAPIFGGVVIAIIGGIIVGISSIFK